MIPQKIYMNVAVVNQVLFQFIMRKVAEYLVKLIYQIIVIVQNI